MSAFLSSMPTAYAVQRTPWPTRALVHPMVISLSREVVADHDKECVVSLLRCLPVLPAASPAHWTQHLGFFAAATADGYVLPGSVLAHVQYENSVHVWKGLVAGHIPAALVRTGRKLWFVLLPADAPVVASELAVYVLDWHTVPEGLKLHALEDKVKARPLEALHFAVSAHWNAGVTVPWALCLAAWAEALLRR